MTNSPPARCSPSKRDIRAGGVFNRTVFGDVSGTLNTEVEHTDGRALIGLGDTLLQALARNTSTDTAHAGLTLNGVKANWHWTLTSNADLAHNITSTERDEPDAANDRALENTASGDVKATANGNLFSLPAGNASTTITLSGSTVHLDTQHRAAGLTNSGSLGRTTGEAAINFDLPISRRNRDFSALGNLTLNGNAEVDQLSDFGTLTTIGAGANWSPVDRLNFIGSWTREEGPPSINQLGDPILTTPGTRIFDFVTGETVLVTAITGGNPVLDADRRNVLKLGANWQPFEKTDLRLRGEYVHQTIARPISNITCDIGGRGGISRPFCARRDRSVDRGRSAAGEFPVFRAEHASDRLRFLDVKSRQPSQAVMDQIWAQFGGRARGQNAGGSQQENSPPAGAPPEGGAPPAGGTHGGRAPENAQPPGSGGDVRGGGRFGGRGGGGFFGASTAAA